MRRVSVNIKQIENISGRLKDCRIKDLHKNREFINFNAKIGKKITAYLFCSAICHQTQSLINTDKNLIGWNYLEYVFMNLAKADSILLDLDYINKRSENELIIEFQQLFPRSSEDTQCALDKLPERIHLIKDIGQVLQQKYESRIENLISNSEMRLFDNGQGLYELINDFEAFKDPLRKKSTLFIKLLYQSGIINILDSERFEPLMDYHMQRLLLRTSCIDILDSELEEKLKNKVLIDSDTEIREKCVEAIKIISRLSGVSVLDLDDILWGLGRSCCNNKIICRDRQCSKDPCTLNSIIYLEKHEECLFEGVCAGSLNDSYRSYWEPQVNTCSY